MDALPQVPDIATARGRTEHAVLLFLYNTGACVSEATGLRARDLRLNETSSRHASVIFNTFMVMLHDGARCLADVRQLKQESALMNLLGMSRLPGASTLGNWLHALGCSAAAMSALDEINRRILKAGLHDCERVPLDIDTTVIETHKKEAKWTYK